jgi:TonB-linked SusC/RagA family outer membrane protein
MKRFMTLLMGIALCYTQVFAQTRTVTGTITDEAGTPLQGATISVVGSNANSSTLTGGGNTTTTANGSFTLTVPTAAIELEITHVGFVTQRVRLGTQAAYSIKMSRTTAGLSEVVVTGYSSRRRSEFTGATAKVSAKQIEQVPMASFEQVLQGRAPGLYIASGSGQPGSYARVNIRGVGSIGGGSDPLYVIDGVPAEPGVFRTLNPNDFESVDVLKDAAGASIYGSRGANGVIVVTTKRGRQGTPVLQYRTQAGINKTVNSKYDLMNTEERIRFEEQYIGPAGFVYPGYQYSPNNPAFATLTPAQQQANRRAYDSLRSINTDWPSIFFRTGRFMQHEVNASGATGGLGFYTSLSYYRQEGTVIRSDLERYTYRGNLDFKSGRLTVQLRSSAGFSKQSGIESEAAIALANPIAAAYLSLPYLRAYNQFGTPDTGAGKIGPNALERLEKTTNIINQFKGNFGVTAIMDIWGGIAAKTTAGIDYRNNNSSRFINPNSYAGHQVAQGQQGSYAEGNAENLQLINTSGLTFTRNINNMHQVNAQAMFEFISNRYRSFSGTGFGINPALPNTPAGITAGSSTNNLIPQVTGGKTRNAIYSVFAIADYTFNRKYTLSASIRQDAFSQVPEANRNNVFWSIGGSWNAAEERFFERQNILDEARIRASYGTAANAAGFASDFGYLATYGASSAGYAGAPAIVPTSPGNASYQIESQAITNVGLDLSTWRRRIRFTFEWYNKMSRNLFVTQEISRTTGFNNLSTNAAQVRNRGVELQLSTDVISNTDWLVTIGLNAAYLQNRIISLGGLNEFTAGTGIYRVGYPLGTHYVVGWVGVDPATGNPIYQDKAGNPTAQYSAANNRAEFGTYLPRWTGGASLDGRFKNFDASILFSFAENVSRYNNERFFYEGGNNNFQYNQSTVMFNAWRKPGDITDIQRIGVARQFTSKDINDASFIRLRNVQLGYTYNFKDNKPIRGIRIYLQGQNLATWTKWQGFDPEESNNIATYEFPNPRTYTVGLDINF